MTGRLKLAVAIGALTVGAATAAGVAYASSDDGACSTPGQLTKAIGPTGTATDGGKQTPADGPMCVPAMSAVPASK